MAYVSTGAEGDWRTDEAPYKEAPGQTHHNKDGTDCYVWSSGYCTELYSVAKTCGDGYRRGDPAKGENVNDCIWIQKNSKGQLTPEPCSPGADRIDGKCYPACTFGFYRSGTTCLPDSTKSDACRAKGGIPRLGNDGLFSKCDPAPSASSGHTRTVIRASTNTINPETGLTIKTASASSNMLLIGGIFAAGVLGFLVYKKRMGTL